MSESYIILDVRGLIIRASSTAEKVLIDEEGNKYASWQAGLAKFLDRDLKEVLGKAPPRNIIAVWDSGNTYRTTLFSDYKRRRMEKSKKTSPDVKKTHNALFSKAKDLMGALGIRQVYVPGEEADDVIGLLVQKLKGNLQVWTVDEDLLQLMSPRVSFKIGHDFINWETHGNTSTKKGTPIKHLVLYKAIVGDSSDEYGGVKGLGPKAWEELASYVKDDGLDWMLQAVSENQEQLFKQWAAQCNHKILNKLADSFFELRQGWKLARITPECCFGFDGKNPKLPKWDFRVPSHKKLLAILKEIDSDFYMKDFEHLLPREILVDATNHEQLQQYANEILASPVVSWDYESYDKNNYNNYKKASKDGKFVDVLSQEIVGVSINFGSNLEKTIYVPFGHYNTNNFPIEWMGWLIGVLNQRETVVQNANFEVTLTLTNLGMWTRPPLDTAIMAMYVNENEENHLKGMSLRYLGYKQSSYEETTKGRSMNQLTANEVLKYGCDDSLVTSHLFDLFKLVLLIEDTYDFYRDNEVEPVLDDVHSFVSGTDIDYDLLKKQKSSQIDLLHDRKAQLHKVLEEHVNLDTETAEEAARRLFKEWFDFDAQKIYGAPDEKEGLQELSKKLWQKAWDSCWYRPYSEQREEIEWKPSAANLTKSVQAIDKDAPKLKKITKETVEAYITALEDYFEDSNAPNEVYEFAQLLSAARNDLSSAKRNTQAYAALKAFCLEQTPIEVKVTKEGDELNTGSPLQMQRMLYGMLRLPIRYRSKPAKGSARDLNNMPGAPGTGLKAVAAALVYDVKEETWQADALHAYKDISLAQQTLSLYYDKYPFWAHPETGKINPQIRNCGTVTRRPSGSAPNILQVSAKEGGAVRKLFPAGDYGDGERVYVSLDWKSEELLILACESRDREMLGAFTSTPRKDLHSLTASGISHVLLPRLGRPEKKWSYDQIIEALHSDDEEVKSAAKHIRGKYAKACIAEGELVLTDHGLVPIEDVQLHHKVWDGIEWVTHCGVEFRGVKEVIDYDGLTATPDHEVFTNGGRKVPIGDLSCQQEDARIAVGGIGETPVYVFDVNAESLNTARRNTPLQKSGRGRKKVFDIINAGPRHRFTVSGKLVSNCNFLIAYGGGYKTLAGNLLVNEELAKQIYYSTLELYSGIKTWQKQVSDYAKRTGYIKTAYGNRRHATSDLMSDDDSLVNRMERQLANSQIQSTAADILKVTRQEIRNRDMVNRYRMRAIKPIYDEFTASVPADLATDYALEMAEIMAITPPGYPVGLEVDIEIGKTWGDQIEVEHQTKDGIQSVINKLYENNNG